MMSKKHENTAENTVLEEKETFKSIYSRLPVGYNAGGRPSQNSVYNAVVGTLGSLKTIDKEDLKQAILALPNVFLFNEIPKHYNLPETFEGKKHTFFGAIRLRLQLQGIGGIIRTLPVHKIFVAHLIEPPEYEKWKKMIDRHPNEHFTEWLNNRDKNEGFMKYDDFCTENGFEHLVHNKPTYLLDKIFKILETTKGTINP